MNSKECIFCKFAQNKEYAVRLYEDDKCFVIMDKFPATAGQTLVISKIHEGYVFNLEKKIYSHLFNIAQKIGKATDSALKSERTCILVEGFDVPHVHIRLHPTYGEGLRRNGKEADDEHLREIAEKIKREL